MTDDLELLELPEVSTRQHSPILNDLTAEERELYVQIPDKVSYIDHSSFASAVSEEALFGDALKNIEIPNWTHFPEVADDVVPRSHRHVLTAKDEATLFLQYNYARYRLAQLVVAQARRQSVNRARQMAAWWEKVVKARSNLVRANMALVLSMAKRTRIPNVEFSELVSEGNMALLRSVEKFDVSRGFKFSTYACRAILKSFNRLATKTGRYRQHFPTEFDPEMEKSDYDVHKHQIQWDDSLEALREVMARNGAHLSELERTIVMERFAIATRGKGRTLAEVGKMVGLTNERVRQIQNLALDKIRETLSEKYI